MKIHQYMQLAPEKTNKNRQCITPAFRVTYIAAIFRHHSTIIFRPHLSTCCLKSANHNRCMPMFVSCHFYANEPQVQRACQWAVTGGFRSVLFAKHVERWMAKDIGYVRNAESGYKMQEYQSFIQLSDSTTISSFHLTNKVLCHVRDQNC